MVFCIFLCLFLDNFGRSPKMGDNKCISCLKQGKHKDVFSLQYKDKPMNTIFQMLTNIQLSKDCIELHLNLICSSCANQLKLFHDFRARAVACYDKLFAMKFIPDENIDESDIISITADDIGYKENDADIVDPDDLEFTKMSSDSDDKSIQQSENDNDEEVQGKTPTATQKLGLMDIHNLFKEESKKWHCEYCNLIFPLEEEEEIEQHKIMEEERLNEDQKKPKNKSKIIFKKFAPKPEFKPLSKTRQQFKRKAKTAVKPGTNSSDQKTVKTSVKMFRPAETEQIRTSTIIKKLPGDFPQLISDINDMLKSEEEEDDEILEDELVLEDEETAGKGKRRFNYINTGNTKTGLKKKRSSAASEIPQKYICEVCGKEMSYASTLRVHMTMHTGKKFVCQLCGSGYVTRAGLQQHMNKHEHRKDFTCNYCGKSFYSNTDLLGHIYDKRQAGSHLDESSAPFTRPICEICGKTFYNTKTLKLHVSTHKQSKDYACPQCDRKFFHEHKLNMHLWTHEVQFRCMKCYNIYKQIELKRHDCVPDEQRQTYEPLEFECRICGQIFKGPGRYEQHQKTHGLKECKFCKKKFNCSAKLFRCHLNTHNFKCSLCDKGFAKKSSWKYHVENQTCLKGKKELIERLY